MTDISIKASATQDSRCNSQKKVADPSPPPVIIEEPSAKKDVEANARQLETKPNEIIEPAKVVSIKQKSVKQQPVQTALATLHTDGKRDAAVDNLVRAAVKDEIVFEAAGEQKSENHQVQAMPNTGKQPTAEKQQAPASIDKVVLPKQSASIANPKPAETASAVNKCIDKLTSISNTSIVEKKKVPLNQTATIVPPAIPETINPKEMIVWQKQKALPKSELELKSREHWALEVDFLLHCVAFAVGLGNIWRFPSVAVNNGGVAFFIPYLLCVFAGSAPMVYMELVLGQFSNRGCLQTFAAISPLFRGIGVAMLFILVVMSTYYNAVVSLSLLFATKAFGAIFSEDIDWARCNNPWNSEYCMSVQDNGFCDLNGKFLFINKTCFDAELALKHLNIKHFNNTKHDVLTFSVKHGTNKCKCNGLNSRPLQAKVNTRESRQLCAYLCMRNSTMQKHPSHEFLYEHIYHLTSENIGSFGTFDIRLLTSLFVTWLFVSLLLLLGRKFACKIVYFTVCAPFLLIFIMLMNSTQTKPIEKEHDHLKASTSHIFNITKAISLQGFIAAGKEAIFSLTPGLGVYIALASYNRFHYSLLSDTAIVVAIDSAASIFYTLLMITTFSLLADKRQVPFDSLINKWTGGPSYIFIAYPEAVANYKRPYVAAMQTFFAVISCFMVGLDSQYIMTDALITNICDAFPNLFITGKGLNYYNIPAFLKNANLLHNLLSVITCLMLFALSLPMCLKGGIQLIMIMEQYLLTGGCCFMMLCQIIVVCYIYDIRLIIQDIQLMYAHSRWGQGLHSSVRRTVYRYLWYFFGPTSYSTLLLWLIVTPLGIGILMVTTFKSFFYTEDWLFMLLDSTGFKQLPKENTAYRIAFAIVLVIALSPIPIILGSCLAQLTKELYNHAKHKPIPNLASVIETRGGSLLLTRLLSPTPDWSPEWWREGGNEVEEYFDDADNMPA